MRVRGATSHRSSNARSIYFWPTYPSAASEGAAQAFAAQTAASPRAPNSQTQQGAATLATQPAASSPRVMASNAAGPTRPAAAARPAPGSNTIIASHSVAAALPLPTTCACSAELTTAWQQNKPTDERTWLTPCENHRSPCATVARRGGQPLTVHRGKPRPRLRSCGSGVRQSGSRACSKPSTRDVADPGADKSMRHAAASPPDKGRPLRDGRAVSADAPAALQGPVELLGCFSGSVVQRAPMADPTTPWACSTR